MGRTGEMILGIVGGIFGLIGAFMALAAVSVVGGLSKAFQNSTDAAATGTQMSGLSGQVWFAVLAAVVGLAGAVIVKSNAKRGGWLMIISAVVGSLAAGFFYVLGGLCLLIAGILALARKEQPQKQAEPHD
ncbi:MAG: DUF4064 domain-containing protein [bacterium]|nr:DUF4064 domain-containing protein [bacterium]